MEDKPRSMEEVIDKSVQDSCGWVILDMVKDLIAGGKWTAYILCKWWYRKTMRDK